MIILFRFKGIKKVYGLVFGYNDPTAFICVGVDEERKTLYKEQSKVEKDLKKTIVRYVDKYVNFAAANELNNIEDIDYIINAFNEYVQDENSINNKIFNNKVFNKIVVVNLNFEKKIS